MKKNDGWVNALFALVFIAVPAMIIYYFILPDWTGRIVLPLGSTMGIAVGFIAAIMGITALLIKFELLPYQAINFNIPVAVGLMVLLVSYDLSMWARVLLIVAVILMAFPVNMFTSYLIRNKKYKLMKK